MKFTDLRVGQLVSDGLFLSQMRVERLLKTRAKLRFVSGGEEITYDKGHVQFLSLVKNKTVKRSSTVFKNRKLRK